MIWPYFTYTGLVKVAALAIENPTFFNSDIRMTLDHDDGLAFFKAVFEHFDCVNNDTLLRIIVPFLEEHPEIVPLNAFRRQDWAANQKVKAKLVLKDLGTL
ncbi:MAG: hypothetical protein WAL98_02875 [Desulfatiglandaceae bacterium]